MTSSEEIDAGPSADSAFLTALIEDDATDLYENAPCAYLSLLPDGTITKANATFLAWTGYERQALVGTRRFQQLLAPGDRIYYETHFHPLLIMQGRVREIAVDLVCQDGRRLAVLVNSVLKTSEGVPIAIRTALFDATERRAYEAELLSARRRAERSEERARSLAQTLQSTFLPPALPQVPGLDVGGAYRPAGDGSEVGGDFYDLFETGRGTWAVVLGDVCGKGAAAAVLTALVRYTIRAEALRTPYPSAVLAAAHDAVSRNYPEQFCTALFAILDHTAEGVRINVASGGHHLPLRVHSDGRCDVFGATGGILGLLDTPQMVDTTTMLASGDVIVLYTDGVTEARNDKAEFFDDDRLRTAVIDQRRNRAQSIADHLVAIALEFQNGFSRDDMAVVVIKVPEVN